MEAALSWMEKEEKRPFVYVNDLFLDPEAQPLQSYTMAIGQFQQDIHLWDVNQDPKDSKELLPCIQTCSMDYMLQGLKS